MGQRYAEDGSSILFVVNNETRTRRGRTVPRFNEEVLDAVYLPGEEYARAASSPQVSPVDCPFPHRSVFEKERNDVASRGDRGSGDAGGGQGLAS